METSLFEDVPGIAFVNLATLYRDGFSAVPVNVMAGTVTLQRVATGFQLLDYVTPVQALPPPITIIHNIK